MVNQAELERALHAALPASQHRSIPQLARVFAEAANSDPLADMLRARLAAEPALGAAARQLAGQELRVGDAVLSFGLERAVGAGNNDSIGMQVATNKAARSISPQHDNRQVAINAGTVEGLLVAFNDGVINYDYTGVTVNIATGTRLDPAAKPRIVRGPTPQPPLPLRSFRDRQQPLADLQHVLRPRGGAWLTGGLGCGLTAVLKQAATIPNTGPFPDGILYVDGAATPASADDIVQELYNCFMKSDGGTLRPDPRAARVELSNLSALFLLDRPRLSGDDIASLANSLAGKGAVVITAEGIAPDTLLDVSLDGLPDKDALALLVGEARVDTTQPETAAFIRRLCAAVDCLPLPLMLMARLIRLNVTSLPQLVAVAEDMRDERLPLARAVRLVLTALGSDENAVLAALVRVGGPDAGLDALAAISQRTPTVAEDALARLLMLRLISMRDDRYALAAGSLRRVLARLLPDNGERGRAAAFFAGAVAQHAVDIQWITKEWKNLLSAARSSLAEGNMAQAGALARAVQPHVVLNGWWDSWVTLLDLADRAAQASGDGSLQAWVLHERGTHAGLLGDLPTAEASLAEAHQRRLELGDEAGAHATLHNMDYLGLLPPPLFSLKVTTRKRFPRWVASLLIGIALLLVVGITRVMSGIMPAVDATPAPIAQAVQTTPTSVPAATSAPTATDVSAATDVPAASAATTPVIDTPPAGGEGANATVGPTTEPINTAPVANGDVFSTIENTPRTVAAAELTQNDTDADGDVLGVLQVSPQSSQGGTITLREGSVTYVPPMGFSGADSFKYTIGDDRGGESSASVNVTVDANTAPTPGNDAVTTQAAQPLAIPVKLLLRNDLDADGDTLTVTAAGPQSEQGGTVTLADEVVIYTPPILPAGNAFVGNDTFTYLIEDTHGARASGVVSVTVDSAVPIARGDTLAGVAGKSLPFSSATLLQNDADPDGDKLTITAIDPETSQSGVIRRAREGEGYVYVPPVLLQAAFVGVDTFSYTIADDDGNTSSATVTVTITPANRPPVALGDQFKTGHGTPFVFSVEQLIGNDSDLDKDPLSVTTVDPQSKQAGTVTLAEGVVTYTPPSLASGRAFVGEDVFSYTLSDNRGGEATAQVIITLGNTTPVGVADTVEGVNGNVIEIPLKILLSNDTDADGDQLQITGVSGRTSQGGTLDMTPDRIYYVPPQLQSGAFVGHDTFSYSVSDGYGGTASTAVTVTIQLPPNQNPVARDDRFTVAAGQPRTILVIQLLDNDRDPDKDLLTVDGVSAQSSQGGTVMLEGERITYTPPLGVEGLFTGDDSFTYTINDGKGGTASATVLVNVAFQEP